MPPGPGLRQNPTGSRSAANSTDPNNNPIPSFSSSQPSPPRFSYRTQRPTSTSPMPSRVISSRSTRSRAGLISSLRSSGSNSAAGGGAVAVAAATAAMDRRARLTIQAIRRNRRNNMANNVQGAGADSGNANRDVQYDSPNHNIESVGVQPSSVVPRSNSNAHADTPTFESTLRSYHNHNHNSREASPSNSSSRRSRSRSRSTQLQGQNNSMVKVVGGSSGSSYLPKILQHLNWAELLPLRTVCKRWLEVISSTPSLTNRLGLISIKNGVWEQQLALYSESPIPWRRFRFEANIFFDMMDPLQLQFWIRHGDKIEELELANNSTTLTTLIEVLSRCPNLTKFRVNWTPEMYAFNSELIKKYYGVNFYNGILPNMKELGVRQSCYLNDNALMSMLKWSGGSLTRLSLTYPPEKEQDPLNRLKPRWTLQPLKNYIERFGHMGNLAYLDFSWSNVTSRDIEVLGNLENLSALKGLTLSHCKEVGDGALAHFLKRKGSTLRKLWIEEVGVSEAIFDRGEGLGVVAPQLSSLNVSGVKGKFKDLQFLHELPALQELIANNTSWLEVGSRMISTLKGLGAKRVEQLRILHVEGEIKVVDLSLLWFNELTHLLAHLASLDLSTWKDFGRNDCFVVICKRMGGLRELRLRDWKGLNDAGVTGLPMESLHKKQQQQMAREKLEEKGYIGSLKSEEGKYWRKVSEVLEHFLDLTVLDLSGCNNITDASIRCGTNYVKSLRKFAFDNTGVLKLSDIAI